MFLLVFFSLLGCLIRQNINILEIKNFVFRNNNLEKIGVLFIFLHYRW